MFIVTNKTEVAKRIRRNRLMFWLGMGCLLGSMLSLFASADPRGATFVFIFGYPLLAIGVILSKRGSFNNRRYGVGTVNIKSEDQMIDDALKGVPNRYHLYNYVNFGGTVVDHLLVTPIGLMIVNVKPYTGKVKVGHDNYRRKNSVLATVAAFGEPALGNPSRDTATTVKKVRAWFEQNGYDLPTDGVIVFPFSEIIGGEEMSFPVCHAGDLKQAIRGWGTELLMDSGEQKDIEKLIIQQLPADEAKEAEAEIELTPAKRHAAEREKMEAVRQAAREAKEKEREEAKAKAKAQAEERKKNPEAAATAATSASANTFDPYRPQRLGLNGKPLPVKPPKEKRQKRDVAPLPKVNKGAFGNDDNRDD